MPIDALANAMGLPLWFVGGVIGLAVLLLAVALTMRFLKARGLMLSAVVIVVCLVNFVTFAWPFWPVVIVGVAMLWQLGQSTSLPALRVFIIRKSRLGTFRSRKTRGE